VISVILLTVIQSPFNLSFLAWIALVPFVIGSLVDEKNSVVLLVAYLAGLLYWLGNLYWLVPITIPGWIVVCLYLGLYWPLVVIALRYCVRKNIPIWFSLPILIVGEEALRGWLFSWRFLAHSQYRNIPLIQIADIFGTAGISFIIAMANGAISETVLSFKNKSYKSSAFLGNVILLSILAAALFYGQYRIDQAGKFILPGPKVGVIQSNVPVVAGEDTDSSQKTFLNLLANSRACLLEARPSLIIWPETMVETTMSDSLLELVAEDDIAQVCHSALLRHANEGVYLLIGAFGGDAYVAGERIKFKTKYNSAFLYEPNQTGPRQYYNKTHLVPFGEYMPLKKELPFLFKILMLLSPYDYDYTLDEGNEYMTFKMPGQNKNYEFGVMICFEDTIPQVARKLALDKNGNKRLDWLVNISNDGWFVRKNGDKITASVELSQRMAICVFRAVENRLSVIRCANTGISCLIDSTGNIKNNFSAGTLNKQAVQRTGQHGWFADEIFIDKRVTAFSKYGQLLAISCAICLIICLIASLLSLRHNGKCVQ
jgi:apolipoprotein N-acyltransferase